jgi:hypothetical protein
LPAIALRLGGWLCRRRRRQFLVLLLALLRGTLRSRTLLLGCLRRHARGRGWLVVVLLLEQHTLPLEGLLLEHLLLLLLEGALALEGLLLLTFLTIPAGFFLQSTPLGPALYT